MLLRPHALPNLAPVSLTNPITPNTLKSLRTILQRENTSNTQPATKQNAAAVLIPFCNVGEVPGILLEVRGKSLRSHSGEVW